jgi:hypothetical protein
LPLLASVHANWLHARAKSFLRWLQAPHTAHFFVVLVMTASEREGRPGQSIGCSEKRVARALLHTSLQSFVPSLNERRTHMRDFQDSTVNETFFGFLRADAS